MQDNELGAATEVRGILDEVIATHANQIGTHHESCYLRHAGCLAVRLRDELGPKPAAAAATTAATTAPRSAPTADEKRELIAEANECSEREREALGDDAYVGGLLRRLSDALEGTLDESEWEYATTEWGYDRQPHGRLTRGEITPQQWFAELGDRESLELLRRRKVGEWEVVADDRD